MSSCSSLEMRLWRGTTGFCHVPIPSPQSVTPGLAPVTCIPPTPPGRAVPEPQPSHDRAGAAFPPSTWFLHRPRPLCAVPRAESCCRRIHPQQEAQPAAGWNQKAPSAWEWQPGPHHMTGRGRNIPQTDETRELCCLSRSLTSFLADLDLEIFHPPARGLSDGRQQCVE